MTNTLKIMHLDFGADGGDATVAAVWNANGLAYLVLIDGGSDAMGLFALSRAWNSLGLTSPSVSTTVISSHYDPAYLAGLVNAVNSGEVSSPNFFDRGQQGTAPGAISPGTVTAANFVNFAGEQQIFARYKQAIFASWGGSGQCETWLSGGLALDQANNASGWTAPTKASQFNGPIVNDTEIGFSVTPLCFDAVLAGDSQAMTTNSPVSELDLGLAVLIQFNGFTYYHGGAITTTQEGGTPNLVGGVQAVAAPTGVAVQTALPKNQIDVAKLSRQGASTASAAGFLSAMNPTVAIVTCGTDRGLADEIHPIDNPSYPYAGLPANLPTGVTAYLTGESLTQFATALDIAPNIVVCGVCAPGDQAPLSFGDITIVAEGTVQSSCTSFQVQYDAPYDSWTQSGGGKTYALPSRFTDIYPIES